jgi:FMN phosphatase YigB (HAD superfamily)
MKQLFNRYVYDDIILNELRTYLFTDIFTHNDDYAYLILIYNLCVSNNIPMYLYSNAPWQWCSLVANKMKIDKKNVYSSEHEILHNQLLYKPDVSSYRRVAYDILKKNAEIEQLIFIDDSLDNLIPLKGSKIWKPILYNPANCIKQTQCFEINSMKTLYTFLDLQINASHQDTMI